jgi:hypothetical protein
MNIQPESEMISEDEINLYDYWKVLVKRKKILIGIFLVPLGIVTIISLSLPRYYRGESEITIPAIPAQNIVSAITAPNIVSIKRVPNGETEITIPALPAPSIAPAMTAPNIASVITASNIVRLSGNIDEDQKVKIFANNSGAIKSVSISIPKKSTDKVNILVDAKTADIMPQAFKDILNYIIMLPEIKGEIAKIETETDLKTQRFLEEIDFKIGKLIEARKANLIFLNQITDMMKKGQISVVYYNPADLIKKDADLSLEVTNLRQAKKEMMMKKTLNVKVTDGVLGPLSITKQPSDKQIKQRIIITGLLSLFAGLFFVFFLEYIERMKGKNMGARI